MQTFPTTAADSGAPTPRVLRFGDLDIAYDDAVLVPRPWTLAQSEWLRDVLTTAPTGPVLELCAGVGHIALAGLVGSGRPAVLVDRDAHACDLARSNARAAGLEVEVRHGLLEEVLEPVERFAAVVADPPWVPTSGIDAFPDDPPVAIDGGSDGLDVARACLRVIADHLLPGGTALLQLGNAQQATSIAERASDLGLHAVDIRRFERGVVVALEQEGHGR